MEEESGGAGAISSRGVRVSGGVIGDDTCGKDDSRSGGYSGGGTSICNGNGSTSIPNRQ